MRAHISKKIDVIFDLDKNSTERLILTAYKSAEDAKKEINGRVLIHKKIEDD